MRLYWYLCLITLVTTFVVAHDGYLMADLKGAVNERYIRKRSSTYLEQFHMEEHGILYLIEIGIGSPPQQVYALIDTGSSDTIIKTEAFNTKYSTTFRGFKYHPFYIVYSAGQMSGIWALETLRIYKQFTIKNYFLAIIDQNTDVNGPPAIIGVGYQGEKRYKQSMTISSSDLWMKDL